MATTKRTLTAREVAELRRMVARGAKVLDRDYRSDDGDGLEWWQKIQVPRFNIRLAYACILGQAYADFSEGLRQLNGKVEQCDGTDYGFDLPEKYQEADVPVSKRNHAWSVLQEAWLEEIVKRQVKAFKAGKLEPSDY